MYFWMELRSTGNLRQSFFDAFSVGSRPWPTH